MSARHDLPLIAVTGARSTGGAWGRYSLGHFMDYLLADYSQALLHAGAAAVIIPAAQDEASLGAVLDRAQGLILSGGPDVHPRRYGEEPIAALGEIDAVLDEMELTAARMAVDRDLPVLGICRGIQVLNIALGGTLFQDLPAQRGGDVCHTPKSDKSVNTHTVQLAAASRLHRICGEGEIWVNSQHHQALKDVAPGLAVTARARDGVVEGVELGGRRFVVGVQWHPEGTWREDPNSQNLFRALVDAARV